MKCGNGRKKDSLVCMLLKPNKCPFFIKKKIGLQAENIKATNMGCVKSPKTRRVYAGR